MARARMSVYQGNGKAGSFSDEDRTMIGYLVRRGRTDELKRSMWECRFAAGELQYLEDNPKEPGARDAKKTYKAKMEEAQLQIAAIYDEYAAFVRDSGEQCQDIHEAIDGAADYFGEWA